MKLGIIQPRASYFSYPLDSIDTKKTAIKRIKNLRIFLSKTPCYFVRGSLEQICDFICSEE